MEYNELIGEIVRKSGLTEEDVREQIRQLVDQIEETAEAGKALEIRGMGMFYLSAKGELVFDASDELAMEINYRYAGMEPVMITPGSSRRKETPSSPPGGDEVEQTLSELFGEETDEKESEEGSGPEEPEALNTTTGKEKTSEIPEEPEEKKKETSTAGTAKKKKPATKRPMPKPRERKRGWFRRKKKERDPIRHLIKTLITIVILGILFHFTLEELKDRGIITDEPLMKTEVKPLPEPPKIEEGPWYGMYGTVEPFDQYHTIALHAVSNRSRADELVGDLRSEGYRGVLSSVEHPEHGTLWRISIGQFETEADARRSAMFLPEPLRQNIFVAEILTP
ncbi:MAG: SPOR domain-containing protein [Balneolaceae bacterium]